MTYEDRVALLIGRQALEIMRLSERVEASQAPAPQDVVVETPEAPEGPEDEPLRD